MNPTDAAAEVQRLLGEAASQLSDADIDAALLRAHVPDPAGLLRRLPPCSVSGRWAGAD